MTNITARKNRYFVVLTGFRHAVRQKEAALFARVMVSKYIMLDRTELVDSRMYPLGWSLLSITVQNNPSVLKLILKTFHIEFI